MPTIMPMHFKAKDGFMHVIPGDDLYPETPNFYEGDHDIDKYADKTMEEMRAIAKNLNRSEQRDLFEVKFFSTVEGLDGKVSLNPDPISKM